ncbi:MAG: hypothetical protein Q9213_008305 [Squamulea squamosa]
MPSLVSSLGNLSLFIKRRKPGAAGNATNCFSCSYEPSCNWSAKKMYIEKLYDKGHTDFPLLVIVPDIEESTAKAGTEYRRAVLTDVLSSDYNASTPKTTIESKQWYGRCMWESDNGILDDQIVTLTWDDDFRSDNGKELSDCGPKTAVFQIFAFTEAQPGSHGGGDGVLMNSFSNAVEAVITGELNVEQA